MSMWTAHATDQWMERWVVSRTFTDVNNRFAVEHYSRTFKSLKSAQAKADQLNKENLCLPN
jgi:hypothetical protein